MDDIIEKIKNQWNVMTKDEHEAALGLASLKYEKLDKETANEIRPLQTRALYEVETVHTPLDKPITSLPKVGHSINGAKLPKYPPLPPNLIKSIRMISDPFEKQLTPSDVTEGQSRFLLPKSFVRSKYLPMLRIDEDLVKGVPVIVYGPNGEEFEMVFKFWTKKNYIINGRWMSLCHRYKLLFCTHWATVWMFRQRETERLCFALSWKYVPNTPALVAVIGGRKRKVCEDED